MKACSVVVNPCESRPCINGGSCLQMSNNYLCQCPYGWGGKQCQKGKVASVAGVASSVRKVKSTVWLGGSSVRKVKSIVWLGWLAVSQR